MDFRLEAIHGPDERVSLERSRSFNVCAHVLSLRSRRLAPLRGSAPRPLLRAWRLARGEARLDSVDSLRGIYRDLQAVSVADCVPARVRVELALEQGEPVLEPMELALETIHGPDERV